MDQLPKSLKAQKEEEILKFWQDNQIFKKTLEKESPKGEYVFYDGPPFATGTPHYGHLLAGTIKDYIGRYQTMQGKHVPRKWGWDCHGLPVENIVEKELGLKSRKDIEEYGIEKFNDKARASVLKYVDDWKKIVPRMGRFVDMEDDYRTMDSSFTETVWWIFNKLNDKGLVYQSFKSMHLCPRCETTLSNFEVNQGYKDITDISVTVKFAVEGEKDTYLLAWTTTPWTLPGNTAIAINQNIDYVKIKVMGSGENYILAKSSLPVIKEDFAIVEEYKGDKLIGKSYKPVFNYYKDVDLENKENIWKIWHADFVTTDKGTGIAHEAPAFGEEDMELAKLNNIPLIRHVETNGTFAKEVKDFVGIEVKPRDDHQSTDILIIKYLAGKGALYSKEKIIHSYPHCWRCETPLLNYASSSWFVEVTKFRDKLVRANKDINWVPADIKEGRFGKWLEGARDWAISRSRYWGAPLPVWICDKCEKKEFVGSVEELKKKTSVGNNFYVVRHGEADNNVLGIISSDPQKPHHLTDKGREQVKETAEKLKNNKIDLVYVSPFIRAQETAKIISEILNIPADKVITDDRIHEVYAGEFDGKMDAEYQNFFKSHLEKFTKTPAGGENYMQIKNRMTEFVYDINTKYKNKNILIVGHRTPIRLMFAGVLGMKPKEAAEFGRSVESFIKNSEIKELPFAPIPHNHNYELDLHRPFIDEIVFPCTCGGKMKRVPEVFDCWFESGSMPFSQAHYPFENLDKFNPRPNILGPVLPFLNKSVGFPAEFIGEGLDQTRGWFYTMLILSVALFGKSSYKNVVVNGLTLASDGKKMSKSLKNYPDPMVIMEKYSADALRYYLLSSSVVKGEDLSFSEVGVDEIMKKIIMRLDNVYSFYEMYTKNISAPVKNFMPTSTNILDLWIIARLNSLIVDVTKFTDKYELDRAVRPIADFIDDLSTWYLRRSRDRFKLTSVGSVNNEGNKSEAVETTRFVLEELAKIIAPVMPFYAEELYQKVKSLSGLESVHLASWPEFKKPVNSDEQIIKDMLEVRRIVSLGLEARAKANIKVRQPLGSFRVLGSKFKVESPEKYFELIKDEVNVKDIMVVENITEEVELDTNITPELKEEGVVRDLTRAIQELRKQEKLSPRDTVSLIIKTNQAGQDIIKKFDAEIRGTTLLRNISLSESAPDAGVGEPSSGTLVVIDGINFELIIIR